MKKALILILMVIMIVLLSSCANYQAMKEIDEKILEIGEVTLQSEKIIDQIDKRILEFEEFNEDKSKNYSIFLEKKTELHILKAREVDKKIKTIGNVVLSSKNIIKYAREAYDGADDCVKMNVKDYQILISAENKLDELLIIDFEKRVSDLGTITLSSDDDVELLITELNAMDKDIVSKISNADTLYNAERRISELQYSEIERRFDRMQAECQLFEDDLLVFYDEDYFISDDWFVYAGLRYIIPGISLINNKYELVIQFNSDAYKSYDLFDKITVYTNEQRYVKQLDDMVVNKAIVTADENDIKMLERLSKADENKIYFGDGIRLYMIPEVRALISSTLETYELICDYYGY